MKGILAATLVFEGLVIFFAVLVAKEQSDVDGATIWWVGGMAAVACVVGAGLVRRSWGLAAGSVLQVLLVAAGFVVPVMFFLGAVFAAIWFLGIYLGRRVERQQASPLHRDPLKRLT